MVLSAVRQRLGHRGHATKPDVDRSEQAIPSVVVPDESAWLLWGRDLRRYGFAAVLSPLGARALVAPSRVPDGLVDAVRDAWRLLPENRRHIALEAPDVDGQPLEDILGYTAEDAQAPADDDAEESPGGEHGHADHEHGNGASDEGHDHHGDGGHGEHSDGGRRRGRAGRGRVSVGPPPDVYVPRPPGPAPAPGAPDRGDHDVQRAGDEQQNMMPIEGDPSTDGLVMESIEVELGPLGTVLPGGLVARVTLDGDVVADCTLEAALSIPRSSAATARVPDPLAFAAWREATSAVLASVPEGQAAPRGWASLAQVELERTASHLVWLRALGGLLGWVELVDAGHAALSPFLDARPTGFGRRAETSNGLRFDLPPGEMDSALAEAEYRLEALRRLLGDSRRLSRRTRGRGQTALAAVEAAGATGPVARAAGLSVDERSGDPRYAELGFVSVVRHESDALARTHLRLDEARESLRLSRAALEREGREKAPDPGPPAEAADGVRRATVEGPRGPVQATLNYADDELRFAAPGQDAMLDLAARSAIGEEWSAALVAVVSFDLSPWRVGL